jgi:hypothetical protein
VVFRSFSIAASIVCAASLVLAQSARAECVSAPLQLWEFHESPIIFAGTAVSITPITPIGEPNILMGTKITFDVDRVWKGIVGKRVDLYMGLSAENPSFEVGRRSPVFARGLIREEKQRLGLGDTEAPVLTAIACTGALSVSEITATFGAGKSPENNPETLEQYIESATGAGVVDCGTFSTIHNGVALPPRPPSTETPRRITGVSTPNGRLEGVPTVTFDQRRVRSAEREHRAIRSRPA